MTVTIGRRELLAALGGAGCVPLLARAAGWAPSLPMLQKFRRGGDYHKRIIKSCSKKTSAMESMRS